MVVNLLLRMTGDPILEGLLLPIVGVLYFICVGLLALTGNALGRFGLKYVLPPLLFPFLGFILSYMRVRDHLRVANEKLSKTAMPNSGTGHTAPRDA